MISQRFTESSCRKLQVGGQAHSSSLSWLSHHHILTEEMIKRRVRESVSAGMRDPLPKGKVFKDVAKGTRAQSVQCFSAANIA